MVMLDDRRGHVDANRPARLAFRLSLAQLRRLRSDEVVPLDELPTLESLWTRLLEKGSVAGQSVFGEPMAVAWRSNTGLCQRATGRAPVRVRARRLARERAGSGPG